MTKKEHTLKWPSIFVSQWIFDFIAKINYFGPFLWPVFLKTLNFFIQVWDKLKTLWCDAPFFSLIEKIFKTCHEWDSNPRPKMQSNLDNCSTNWAIKNSKRNWWCNFNQCKSNQTQLNPSNLNQRTLELLEWKLFGDFSKSITNVASKET